MSYEYRGDIWLKRLEVGEYGNNCYIIIDPVTKQSAIIDAPAEPERIIEAAAGTHVKYVLITHTHGDHIGALRELVEATNPKVGVHPVEAEKIAPYSNLMLNENDTLQIGNVPLRILHTPGHTPGSSCFITGNHLFTGDTLFPGGPGRSASPNDLIEELSSITKKLLLLGAQTIVYPGHGAGTSIADAQSEYAYFASQSHPADLHGDVLWMPS
jgi:hydroxyacylglutathione hydrolase